MTTLQKSNIFINLQNVILTVEIRQKLMIKILLLYVGLSIKQSESVGQPFIEVSENEKEQYSDQ